MTVADQVRRILADSRELTFEKLKKQASDVTLQYFGRTITLFAPLYLGNYCENNCVYCGFSSHHKIPRTRLNDAELHKEMNVLSKQGIQNIEKSLLNCPQKNNSNKATKQSNSHNLTSGSLFRLAAIL